MLNNEKSISVVIPTHDRPELLKNAIDSVLSQSEAVDEIIIVDDTESAATKKLVDSYNNIKVKCVHNPNSGACSSRNLGARLSTSAYVAFLDDDDTWLENKIFEQKKFLPENDAVFTRLYINYEGKNICYETKGKLPVNPKKEICIENFIGGTITSVIRRELFLKINGFDEDFPAREEYDLWIRILKDNAKIRIVEQPLVIANRSLNKRERISANINNYEMAIDLLNKKHKEYICNILSEDELRKRRSSQFQFLAAQAISIGLRKVSFKYYLKSFILSKSIKAFILSMLSLISPILIIKLRSYL